MRNLIKERRVLTAFQLVIKLWLRNFFLSVFNSVLAIE